MVDRLLTTTVPEPQQVQAVIEQEAAGPVADRHLDITADVCPMTFVRTRLALDRMQPGQTLLVLLRGEEPTRNVPRTAVEQGHAVLSLSPGVDGTQLLLLRRG